MSEQKYHKGDHVQVAKDLGESMSHFTSDCEAIVIGSYTDQYGGGRESSSYTLHLKGRGQSSWYDEWQLELIEANRLDLLEQWEEELKQDEAMKSDLDWIFSHGRDVLKSASGATVEALAKGLGCTNLWGSRGEGITYYQNALFVLGIAKPYLEGGDKEGWLKLCAEGVANE